ncbi:MAG: hypothetical protein U0R19_35340 [Bryobacteraceae bacterium]
MSSDNVLGLATSQNDTPQNEKAVAHVVVEKTPVTHPEMTLDEVREIGSISQLVGCTAEARKALKTLHDREVDALALQQASELRPLTTHTALLEVKRMQLEKAVADAASTLSETAASLLEVRCEEARIKGLILGIVLRIRAHLKEQRLQEEDRERERAKLEAEASFDKLLSEWHADTGIWQQHAEVLQQQAARLDVRITKSTELLSHWDNNGFSVKVQAFFLWMGYAVLPSLSIILASLLYRMRSGQDSLLTSADPVGALSAVVTNATQNPRAWFTQAATYVGVIVGLGLFALILLTLFDSLLRRIDRAWAKKSGRTSSGSHDAQDFLIRLHGLVLPGSEGRSASDPQDRQAYLALLRRIPFLVLGGIVFYIALQLAKVQTGATSTVPAPYLLVGFALPLLAAGSGIVMGLAVMGRPRLLSFLPAALLLLAISVPFVVLLPEKAAWPTIASYLSLAMVAVGLALVHRGIMISNEAAMKERNQIQQILTNLRATPSKTTFVLNVLEARSAAKQQKAGVTRRQKVVLTVERRLPAWVTAPLFNWFHRTESAAPVSDQAERPESPGVPATESLNDPLLSRPGIPEELRAGWEKYRGELDVVVQRISAKVASQRQHAELVEQLKTTEGEWRKEADALAQCESDWAGRIAALKARQAQQWLAFELAAELAREAAIQGGRSIAKGAGA